MARPSIVVCAAILRSYGGSSHRPLPTRSRRPHGSTCARWAGYRCHRRPRLRHSRKLYMPSPRPRPSCSPNFRSVGIRRQQCRRCAGGSTPPVESVSDPQARRSDRTDRTDHPLRTGPFRSDLAPPTYRSPTCPSSRCHVLVNSTDSSMRRSWETSSSVPAKDPSANSSCSMAGRSRWLVGSSRTRRLTPSP